MWVRSGWSNRVAVVTGSIVVVIATLGSLLPGDLGYNVPQTISLVLLVGFLVGAAVRAVRERSWIWAFIAWSSASLVIAQVGFMQARVDGGPDTAGTKADLFYLVGLIVGAISFGRLVFGRMHGARLFRSISDGVLVGAGLIFIVWSTVFDKQFVSLIGSARSDQYGRLAMVAIDLMVAGILVMAAVYQPRRMLLRYVAVCVAALAVADIAYCYLIGEGRPAANPLSVAAWTTALFCAMAASLAPDTVVDGERVTTPKRRVIYLVMLAAAVAAIYGVFESGGIQGTKAALVMAVFAALVVNQILVNVELRQLHRSNEEALGRMAASERRFRAAFEGSPVGVAIMTLDGTMQLLNPTLASLIGGSVETLRGTSLLSTLGGDQRIDLARRMADIFRGERDLDEVEALITRVDGSDAFARVTISRYQGQDGSPRMIGLVEDITETRAAVARLEHLAGHDPLTGLANRQRFTEGLTAAIEKAAPDGHPLAIAFLDLDRFKVINDSLGHDVGDHLLLEVSRRLTSAVGEDGMVARFGGDEFTLLMHPSSASELRALIERLLRSVAEPVELPRGERFHPTVSIGVSVARPGTTSDRMISEADAAMYRAKERGRNRAEFYVSSGRRTAQVTLRLIDELHRAIERDELEVLYQPIVDLRSGRTSGFEALVRWNHPNRGQLAPHHFLGVAEEAGLIVPIGEWVLRTAASTAASWPQSLDGPPLSVSVNVAARQLVNPSFPGVVASALTDTGLPADRLWLETTETAIMTDPRAAAEALRELRGFGLHLALDDFGTGYSSLTYLKRFPFEAMKVDRSFVAGLAVNADDTAIVSAVVGLARSLGLLSVAEGVESPLQLSALRDLDCDQSQGFLLGAPLRGSDVTAMLSGESETPVASESETPVHAGSETPVESRIEPTGPEPSEPQTPFRA